MQRRYWIFAALLFASSTARAAVVTPGGTVVFDLPVKSVTVYSDRARVVREGDLNLPTGTNHLNMARLPPSIDPESVRVTATGGRIAHVMVHRAGIDELPKTQAQALIDQLDKLNDAGEVLVNRQNALDQELQLLGSVRFQAEPIQSEKLPPLLLNPAGWNAVLAFFDDRESSLNTLRAKLDDELRLNAEAIAKASEEARLLLGTNSQNSGYIVVADVEAKSAATHVAISYVAAGARWYPAYDIHYSSGSNSVQLGMAGLVSQQTGEDWDHALLTLSTAVPSNVTNVPQLAVWRIGDRERFIPTPQAGPPEDGFRPPRRPGPVPTPMSEAEGPDLRQELSQAMRRTVTSGSGSFDLGGMAAEAKPAEKPTQYVQGVHHMAKAKRKAAAIQMDMDGASAVGDMEAETTSRVAEAPPPPMAMPTMMPQSAPMTAATGSSAEYASEESVQVRGRSVEQQQARQYLTFRSPQAWRLPPISGDLPASLAGGYDFTYEAAQPESVRSGAEARRVALYTMTLPAQTWIKILPALGKSAYLVAEVTNSGAVPLLRGKANLFVGSDLVGDATVPTTAPGEKVTLSLGIDDAVRVERNVQLVASERGLFQKDDVGAYDVAIEVLNTHTSAIPVRVTDQVPMGRQEEVTVKLVSVDPAQWKNDQAFKEEGALEWRVDVPAGQKKTLKFRYEVTRPKGWKLWQTATPGVSR